MALKLKTIAGFADLQNSVLSAEDPALAIHASMIINNAQFGMVRIEFFQDKYHDGDTVILPTSPIDGYNYTRDELLYFWNLKSTQNAGTGWLTGPDCLWYLNHNVDQVTGDVSSEEWYRKSSVHNPDGAKSNDGVLLVTTVAQRQLKNLVVLHEPTFQGDMSPSIAVDNAWQECLIRKLNVGAKFAALKTEFIYMGEFVNGDTVPTPVSPADGHAYTYAECQFLPSWRWSTTGAAYKQPDNYLGQLQRLQMSVSSIGAVTARVDYKGDENSQYQTAHGRLAVWALTSRDMTIGAVGP